MPTVVDQTKGWEVNYLLIQEKIDINKMEETNIFRIKNDFIDRKCLPFSQHILPIHQQ